MASTRLGSFHILQQITMGALADQLRDDPRFGDVGESQNCDLLILSLIISQSLRPSISGGDIQQNDTIVDLFPGMPGLPWLVGSRFYMKIGLIL